MKTLQVAFPDSLYGKLQTRAGSERVSVEHVILSLLADSTDTPLHTLFQVSTSSALVEGLYQGAVRVGQLLERGDFGLGTFIDLNGEMVVLDGVCYQLEVGGKVSQVEEERLIPYGVVTWFEAEFTHHFKGFPTLSALTALCDTLRISNNIFCAFKVEGVFTSLKLRIMRAVGQGVKLKEAASGQEETSLQSERGTLIGIWSPRFAGPFIVPGYHFHFLSDDRTRGGHLLECSIGEVSISGCAMHELHVSLPETEEYLKADLSRDPSKDLEAAESIQS